MKRWGRVLLVAAVALLGGAAMVGDRATSGVADPSPEGLAATRIGTIEVAPGSSRACAYDANVLADARTQRPLVGSYCPIDGVRHR